MQLGVWGRGFGGLGGVGQGRGGATVPTEFAADLQASLQAVRHRVAAAGVVLAGGCLLSVVTPVTFRAVGSQL